MHAWVTLILLLCIFLEQSVYVPLGSLELAIAKDNFEFLIFLSLPLNAGITGCGHCISSGELYLWQKNQRQLSRKRMITHVPAPLTRHWEWNPSRTELHHQPEAFSMGLRHYAASNPSTEEAEDLCEFKASLILGQGYTEKCCLKTN